jgi:hypothetical protein
MHVRFDPSIIKYDNFFQVGSGPQQYFEGSPVYFQRGHGYYSSYRQSGAGLGDVFRRLWRFLKPVVSSAGRAIGEEGLATTARVLTNVVEGGDLKEAITSESKEGIRNLLSRAEKKIASTQQKGQGRKRRQKKSVMLKPEDFIGKSVLKNSFKKKKSKVDALGSF